MTGEARNAWHAWAERRLPPDVLVDMEIVLGEAVSNVARHSGSTTMEVLALSGGNATANTGFTVLDVVDTGCGFVVARVPEPDMTSESGRGLWLMRHVARVYIASRPGLTIVSARREW